VGVANRFTLRVAPSATVSLATRTPLALCILAMWRMVFAILVTRLMQPVATRIQTYALLMITVAEMEFAYLVDRWTVLPRKTPATPPHVLATALAKELPILNGPGAARWTTTATRMRTNALASAWAVSATTQKTRLIIPTAMMGCSVRPKTVRLKRETGAWMEYALEIRLLAQAPVNASHTVARLPTEVVTLTRLDMPIVPIVTPRATVPLAMIRIPARRTTNWGTFAPTECALEIGWTVLI
jgi:hypothetical protein